MLKSERGWDAKPPRELGCSAPPPPRQPRKQAKLGLTAAQSELIQGVYQYVVGGENWNYDSGTSRYSTGTTFGSVLLSTVTLLSRNGLGQVGWACYGNFPNAVTTAMVSKRLNA